MMIQRIRTSGRPTRRGVAVAELAICLPMLVLLTLGTIETCSMIYLKQSLSIAAYEGARVALIPTATNRNAVAQCDQILDDRGIQYASVNVSPNVSRASSGTMINVDISAPCDANGVLPSVFFRGRNVSATVVMMKER